MGAHSVAFGWPGVASMTHTPCWASSMQYQSRPPPVTSYCPQPFEASLVPKRRSQPSFAGGGGNACAALRHVRLRARVRRCRPPSPLAEAAERASGRREPLPSLATPAPIGSAPRSRRVPPQRRPHGRTRRGTSDGRPRGGTRPRGRHRRAVCSEMSDQPRPTGRAVSSSMPHADASHDGAAGMTANVTTPMVDSTGRCCCAEERQRAGDPRRTEAGGVQPLQEQHEAWRVPFTCTL